MVGDQAGYCAQQHSPCLPPVCVNKCWVMAGGCLTQADNVFGETLSRVGRSAFCMSNSIGAGFMVSLGFNEILVAFPL